MAETQITAEPGVPQVVMTRAFAAPRGLVFRAYTDPDLLVQWLRPRDVTMTIDRYDARDGGTYRYVHTAADGTEFRFRGVFHGDPAPHAIVQTFEYEGTPGHVSLNTITLEERDSTTVVRTVSSFASVEDRDYTIAAGMEHGIRESDERLDELLTTLPGRTRPGGGARPGSRD
jgi:uncharacterized protein YndB with AHSA1/START domain